MITLLVGKSGAGKDTYLRRKVEEGVKPVISYTSRPIRAGEVNGIDYNFVTDAEFDQLNQEGKMFETRSYNTLFDGRPAVWKYGSPRVNPAENYVAVVDVNGAKSYIEAYGPENIDIIYIFVDDKERKRRAKLRGSFSEPEWERRAKDDEVKFSETELISLEDMLGKPITRFNNN